MTIRASGRRSRVHPQPFPACRTAPRALLDFGGQQSFQGDGQRQSFWGGLVQGRWQGLGGGVQFELGQV